MLLNEKHHLIQHLAFGFRDIFHLKGNFIDRQNSKFSNFSIDIFIFLLLLNDERLSNFEETKIIKNVNIKEIF